MRILWVTTKLPFPPVDGGRLAVAATLEALAGAGAELTLVAPAPEGTPGPGLLETKPDRMVTNFVRIVLQSSHPLGWANATWRSLGSGRPVQIERHGHPALGAKVGGLARLERFDVVHAEQLQSLSMARPARAAGAALVLRAQNVESAVWEALGAGPRGSRRGPGPAPGAATATDSGSRGVGGGAREALRAALSPLARIEAGRMRRYESAAIGDVDATIALSTTDATRLSALNPSANVVVVPPPFLASMGTQHERPAGDTTPVFTWLGSRGWPPNEEALRWLIADVWPAIAATLPQARLDIFGGGPDTSRTAASQGARANPDARQRGTTEPTIAWRAAPRDSAEAFGAGTIMLLPLRTAAGVRMRLLEAWARGVAVIASPAAVDGLDTEHGRDVLVAADARQFADAAARLTTNPALRAHLIEQGRATLLRRHDPATIAHAILDVYRDAIARRRR